MTLFEDSGGAIGDHGADLFGGATQGHNGDIFGGEEHDTSGGFDMSLGAGATLFAFVAVDSARLFPNCPRPSLSVWLTSGHARFHSRPLVAVMVEQPPTMQPPAATTLPPAASFSPPPTSFTPTESAPVGNGDACLLTGGAY
jgi:hypothetical protein